MRIRHFVSCLAIGLVLAACGGKTNDGNTSGAGNGNQAGGGGNAFVGSFTTSPYSATWTAAPDAEIDPFNSVGSVTLISDKQTHGNIRVMPDGSISFGSGDAPLGGDTQVKGSGAHVTLDKSGAFVCAFTVDNDLTGSNGATVHLKGGMTVHWHPQGLGDVSCP